MLIQNGNISRIPPSITNHLYVYNDHIRASINGHSSVMLYLAVFCARGPSDLHLLVRVLGTNAFDRQEEMFKYNTYYDP